MMRPKRIFALLAVLLLLLSSCKNESGGEPAVSASVTEDRTPVTTAEDTAPSHTEEVTDHGSETIPEETTEAQAPEVADRSAREILELSESLAEAYTSYIRESKTDTEINILGDISQSSTTSELIVSEGSAYFNRGDEKYYLVGGELYFDGSLAKYRVGGYDMASFLSLIGDSLPLSDFEGGSVRREGEELVLFFDTLGEDGKAYLRSMLALGDTLSLDIKRAELTVRTDTDGNMSESELLLSLSVGKDGQELMTVSISAKTELSYIGSQIYLVLPTASDYLLFPDLETVALYETAFADYASFTSNYDAYEYIERDVMTISSDGIDLNLTSKTDYAFASRIGASIGKSFDTADGTGIHYILTHFNNRRGFSQIDGGSIFVDTSVNKNNLSFTLYHPFETSIYQIGSCIALESAENGKIILTLNDEAVRSIAEAILLHAGIPAADLKILEIERGNTFITADKDGKFTTAGYSFAAIVSVNGQTYTLSRDVSLEITARGTAKVTVIYIEVDEEEEE